MGQDNWPSHKPNRLPLPSAVRVLDTVLPLFSKAQQLHTWLLWLISTCVQYMRMWNAVDASECTHLATTVEPCNIFTILRDFTRRWFVSSLFGCTGSQKNGCKLNVSTQHCLVSIREKTSSFNMFITTDCQLDHKSAFYFRKSRLIMSLSGGNAPHCPFIHFRSTAVWNSCSCHVLSDVWENTQHSCFMNVSTQTLCKQFTTNRKFNKYSLEFKVLFTCLKHISSSTH